jgi:hypothetical protein
VESGKKSMKPVSVGKTEPFGRAPLDVSQKRQAIPITLSLVWAGMITEKKHLATPFQPDGP